MGGLLLLAIGAVLVRALVPHAASTSLQIGSKTYSMEWATTNHRRVHGLSNRESLPDNHGMIFVFPENGEHCFWMKDTNFALDILWLNEHKQITNVYRNVTPETYPKSFCSDYDGRYGIELPAGSLQESGPAVGDYINL